MSKFKIIREFKLDFLGEGWENGYLKFEAFTYKELAKLSGLEFDTKETKDVLKATEGLMEMLMEKFVEGKGADEKGAEVPIAKEDLSDLPLDVIGKAVNFLAGVPNA